MKIKLFGRFQLIVKNVKTGKIKDTGWIENLVLNNCFNYNFANAGNASWVIELGTGSTPPTFSDLSLETPLVSISAGSYSSVKAGASTDFVDPIYSTSAGWETTFALGAVVGNVSEIGVSASGNLFTRSLITDGAGDPTVLVVGVNDILTVNYLMGYEMDTSHPAGSVTVDFDGVDINLTAKWVGLGQGASNLNGMNGQVLPYIVSSWTQQRFWVVDTLPSDPLSDINGGVTPITYLTSSSGVNVTGTWSSNLIPTGSSWTKEMTFTSLVGGETGGWNGVAIGGSAASTPIVLFEFDSTFTKLSNKQIDITVKYEIQRA